MRLKDIRVLDGGRIGHIVEFEPWELGAIENSCSHTFIAEDVRKVLVDADKMLAELNPITKGLTHAR